MSIERVFPEKRGKIEIVANILWQLEEPSKKTQIMRRCNLSYNQLKRYLSFTRSNGLVERRKNSETTTYHRTGKGLKFLRLYKDIAYMLRS